MMTISDSLEIQILWKSFFVLYGPYDMDQIILYGPYDMVNIP